MEIEGVKYVLLWVIARDFESHFSLTIPFL